MKIVIISRQMHPANSPRAFRSSELAKSLAKLGHEISHFAILSKYDYTSYEQETGIKVRSFGKIKFAAIDIHGNRRNSLFDKIMWRLRMNKWIEYPDIEFSWKTYKILKREQTCDLLITIATPYPIHWGAAVMKSINPNLFPKFWISDCGDPYMLFTYVKKPPFYFKYIENFWGKSTDYITVPTEKSINGYYEKLHSKIKVIPQGIDFTAIKTELYCKNKMPTFIYAGRVDSKYRDPTNFLIYLSSLRFDFRFIVYSKSTMFESFMPILKGRLIIKPTIPRYELIYELSKADFLINIKNEMDICTPSKLIDYAMAKRPILEISSHFKEQDIFECFIKTDYTQQLVIKNIENYDSLMVAKQFLKLYEDSLN